MGLLEGLALIFIVLKLIGTIDWSWWWVLSPIWGAIAFYVFLFGSAIVGYIFLKK